MFTIAINLVSADLHKSYMFADIYKHVAVLNGFVPLKKSDTRRNSLF